MPTEKMPVKAYLSDDELLYVKAQAEKRGLSVANWLRVKIGLKPLVSGAPKGNQNAKKPDKSNYGGIAND